ncbi:Divalent-cation tolerance protein CutA [Rosistilla ulvae]|uniref:Divalent-cation tolerance protein CutA n=1 Tax=Rosistilla ulvae TaxID=1930277 RepID=A0A517M1R1_9BACT|nr:divalent-cation tolerance protein CutA [Rosistilla ulvae]QDS88808.1 Divalent-cation tolerance protein CutA [Rosistilla ulvae]
MEGFLQITTTTASEAEATAIAARLIELRYAACVQVEGPIASHYRWDGSVHCEPEFRLSIKTVGSRLADVERLIEELHSYQQPEIIAVPIVAGAAGYLDWITEQTR